MDAAIRNDGKFTIYVVEWFYDKKWHYAGSADHFAANIPENLRYRPERPHRKWLSPWKDFGANGDCWQKTGIEGVFDPQVGMAFIGQLTEYNPGVQFRLAEVSITQKTKPYKG